MTGSMPEALSRPTGHTLSGVSRYVPVRPLWSGLDGSVMLARRPGSGHLVELRHATIARTDPVRWQAIEQAAKVYALLDHPGFRKLEAFEVHSETPVLVFEACLEPDLGTLLRERGALAALDAWQVFKRVAQALEVSHRLGLGHGKLGPSAIRMREGQPQLDFTWLELGEPQTELDRACLAPEAGTEQLDASSDVYALGMLLQVMLVGHEREPPDLDRFGPLAVVIRELTQGERETRPSMTDVCNAIVMPALEHSISTAARARAATEVKSSPRSDTVLDTLDSIDTMSLSFDQALDQVSGSFLDSMRPVSTAAVVVHRPALKPGMILGRYQIVAKIGEGGMGEVFRAVDRANGTAAALKVLRPEASADPAKLRRFRKEARILSDLRSPYIAALIEMNRDAELDFIALEFVDGGDLADLLDSDGGKLPERDALSIIADVCRGLGEAHARGVVHRDIKPPNIMIARPQTPGDQPQVKLCDFGIARALDRAAGTLAFTQEDALLGTPDYMAPEQCNGSSLSPATDVYALGVTLFLLISGRMPFAAEDPIVLMIAHTSEEPPTLSSVAPEVSEATSQLVARMLAKAPADRFADAVALLEAIERILRGEPTSIEVHPARPVIDQKRVVRHAFEWELSSLPDQLWPYVSNTDRLNRAVGLPPAVFDRVSGALGIETSGKNRVAGVNLNWREHPFEWVEGKRWGVLRVFQGGVMHWFTIELELIPKAGGGTRLRYVMTLEPRHVFGRWIVAFEMRHKQRPALGEAFMRIDAYASAQGVAAVGVDAFEPPAPLSDLGRSALTRGLAKLRDDGVKEEMLDVLASFCTGAPDQEIARLRPLAFASAHALDADRVVDACLRAAHHGVFTLLWDILCPLCRIPSDFAQSLKTLADHGHCPSCNTDFTLDFANSIELVFRVSPEIRQSELRTYCVGGPAFAPHVVAQARLAAGERLTIDFALAHGAYKIRSPQLPYAFSMQVSNAARLHRGGVRFTGQAPDDSVRLLLATGSQSLSFENTLDHEIVMRVERSAPREDALTAARAACLSSFRTLFPGEVLSAGRMVAVGRTAFVVVHVHGQRALLKELGDARTFERVLTLLALLEEVVASEAGALVKTHSGTSLCAFESAAAAARAALQLRARLDALEAERLAGGKSSSRPEALDIRIVVHVGPAVAATFDGRLDYFGHTVETAVDLVLHAPARRVLLSAAVSEDQHAIADLGAAGYVMEGIEVGPQREFGVAVTA